MLYELIAVVRTGNTSHVKDIARSTGQLILSPRSSSSGTRGTIRSITNWGVFDLPKPTVKHQTQHYKGHYFIMQFDASAATQAEVRRQLGLNPHMIRFSVVKVGDKLGGKSGCGGMEGVTGEVGWNRSVKNEIDWFATKAKEEMRKTWERRFFGLEGDKTAATDTDGTTTQEAVPS